MQRYSRFLGSERLFQHRSISLACAGPADGSMFAVSLEESMDRMDADGLAEERSQRSRAAAAGAAVSDLRSAVDAAMEMQQVAKKARSASGSLSQSLAAMDLDRGAAAALLSNYSSVKVFSVWTSSVLLCSAVTARALGNVSPVALRTKIEECYKDA